MPQDWAVKNKKCKQTWFTQAKRVGSTWSLSTFTDCVRELFKNYNAPAYESNYGRLEKDRMLIKMFIFAKHIVRQMYVWFFLFFPLVSDKGFLTYFAMLWQASKVRVVRETFEQKKEDMFVS